MRHSSFHVNRINFSLDWLRYNCITNSGSVARLMPNLIRIYLHISLHIPFSLFLYLSLVTSLSSTDEFSFGQFLRHLPLRWIVWAISDRLPCAYRAYITNKGKCARLLNSPIYTCKGSQDSINVNRICAGQMENMRKLIFVFPLDTFSCDADHKF